MSSDVQIEATDASRKTTAIYGSPTLDLPSRPVRFGLLSGALMVGGGLATGLLAVGLLAYGVPSTPSYELQTVKTEDIAAASQSLIATQAGHLVEDAKSCRTPLAYLVIRPNGTPGGSIRFRSGAYLTPNIRLASGAVRTALPFPAPYAVGHGQIIIETNTTGTDLFLIPGAHVETGVGSTTLNVHWTPKSSC